jgi:hypothetical protein
VNNIASFHHALEIGGIVRQQKHSVALTFVSLRPRKMTLFVYINYLVTVIFTSSLPASKLKGAAVIAPLVPSFGLLLIVCCKQ